MTVFFEPPSSAAIRFSPQPSPLCLTAAKSSFRIRNVCLQYSTPLCGPRSVIGQTPLALKVSNPGFARGPICRVARHGPSLRNPALLPRRTGLGSDQPRSQGVHLSATSPSFLSSSILLRTGGGRFFESTCATASRRATTAPRLGIKATPRFPNVWNSNIGIAPPLPLARFRPPGCSWPSRGEGLAALRRERLGETTATRPQNADTLWR